MMKRFVVFVLILSFTLTSCAQSGKTTGASNDETLASAKAEGKLTIVATLFPQFDFARTVAGGKADVMLLLPPGVESHTFDPTPSDMFQIYDSDVFLYTGAEMEPWAQRVIAGASPNTMVVNVCDGIELFGEEHADDDGEDGHAHSHEYDPHVWLDLRKAVQMLDNIAGALCEKDSANEAYYLENANGCKRELLELDGAFSAMISASARDTLVFGGRFAYQYFLTRYGLNYVTVTDSCSSASEPSVARVAEVIDYIKGNSIPCVFHEEFVDPRIARSIAAQTGAKLELFSTAHNVTKDQLLSGATFIDIMRLNFESVKRGLN